MLHSEKLPLWLIEDPDPIVGIGTFTLFVATVLMMLAAWGKILFLFKAAALLAAEKYVPARLSDLNLSWPTWFIAESWVGYILSERFWSLSCTLSATVTKSKE